MKRTTILIVDDHKLVRETWAVILNQTASFNVVGACGTVEEALSMVQTLFPEIVIQDINLPGMNGMEAVTQILRYSPHSKILGISMHTQPVYARKMMKNGAMGYLTKNSEPEEMFHALKEICAGRKYICNQINEIITQKFIDGARPEEIKINSLSRREIEIIELIKKGCSSKEMAVALDIAIKTVEVHRYNILKKLNLPNSAALSDFMNNNYR
ncbi:response regulator transcription factor [Chitinophagaceae bacterium 26-R-25]|nr:response regulator transcription factor [Chitinophagaceae bacterium 26-R-25]